MGKRRSDAVTDNCERVEGRAEQAVELRRGWYDVELKNPCR
jgi:hypothetical protein